jgi:UDP-N-acetylglucosamine 1-carboxyvinyltransferase
MAVAMAGGDVTLAGAPVDLLGSLITTMAMAGIELTPGNRGLRVERNGGAILPVSVATAPYPGFPTDLQAQLMALMTRAEGVSQIRETIFENRFMHVQELARLGADITLNGDTAVVRGVKSLRGAEVMATDLRASVSLVIAGLAAEGDTVIHRVYHLDRGLEALEAKLAACGADVVRISS